MARAEVGDDVYGEDPTVARLERRAAELTGKGAALLVPSGTMANQIAIRALTRPGDVLLAGEGAHVLRYESGAAAGLFGVQIQSIGSGGLFDARDVQRALPVRDVHLAPVTALALENTHNGSGGRVWSCDLLDAVTRVAKERGLGVHLDGARLFNAACAAGEPVARLAAGVDTVAFCLSKGLGAPVGSLLCSDESRIEELRRTRKMLGGGMRQAGVLAAAGLYALDHHVEGLRDDHEDALVLAKGLQEQGLSLSLPETNLVYFRVPEGRSSKVPDAIEFARRARAKDLLIDPTDRHSLRAVTHLDVGRERVLDALDRIRGILD